MPTKNHFQHCSYSSERPEAPWRLVNADFPAQPGTEAFKKNVADFREAIADQLDAIWLVHGTFAGNDALGWFGQLERLAPSAGSALKNVGKKLTDFLAGDSGNYTAEFAELIDVPIPVRRFIWSGENTHSGRCKAALELAEELLSRVGDEKRVLLCGHSHAGNIAALITNLLGAEDSVRDQFLELGEKLLPRKEVQGKSGSSLRKLLKSTSGELALDVANFGMPICYGWETTGWRKLLHVVNHRKIAGSNEWLCPVVEAKLKNRDRLSGDWVQVMGITGSNFLPWLLDSETRSAEKELHDFLAQGMKRSAYWSRVKHGMRVAPEGETVLVAYDNTDGHAAETAGHSVYTKPQWLAFHLDLLAGMYS